ncbi:MAG: phage major capsid protein, partial [Rhizobiaceae bacterium]|nr:phage major capsid protein [Rhizobiaceae bacterium]
MKTGNFIAALCVASIACAVIAFTVSGAVDLAAFVHTPHALGTSLAMTMAPALNHRARGLTGVRADSSNAAAILAELKQTFEAFKAERDAELKGINAKLADVVQTEKVDRINSEVTKLQKALDDVNATLAAIKIGGGSGDAVDPAKAEHATAFNKWFRKGDRAVDADMRDLEVKASLSTLSDPDGGYVFPEEMSNTIDRVVGTVSAMRSIATAMTISTDTYKKLVNMGGADAGWVGEKDARPETATPTLRELVFNTAEIYANPAATQTLLDDARVDIAAWLANEVSITFAEQEGAAFISGNGVMKPRGILAYDTVANASYAWGKIGFTATGAAADFAATNPADALISLFYSLKQGYRNGASWLTSDAVMETI